ncbi:hypothetical protein FRB93_013696 [Tulasnella sp. JGI-2019a]|nr:hypothetical protein FRB93_013696 [Tulasnella sp. JGI-2019a]
MSTTMSTHSEDPDNEAEAEISRSVGELNLRDGNHTPVEPEEWVLAPAGPECYHPQEPGKTVRISDEELAAVIDRRNCQALVSK